MVWAIAAMLIVILIYDVLLFGPLWHGHIASDSSSKRAMPAPQSWVLTFSAAQPSSVQLRNPRQRYGGARCNGRVSRKALCACHHSVLAR